MRFTILSQCWSGRCLIIEWKASTEWLFAGNNEVWIMWSQREQVSVSGMLGHHFDSEKYTIPELLIIPYSTFLQPVLNPMHFKNHIIHLIWSDFAQLRHILLYFKGLILNTFSCILLCKFYLRARVKI